jgi:hypothetical protein
MKTGPEGNPQQTAQSVRSTFPVNVAEAALAQKKYL